MHYQEIAKLFFLVRSQRCALVIQPAYARTSTYARS